MPEFAYKTIDPDRDKSLCFCGARHSGVVEVVWQGEKRQVGSARCSECTQRRLDAGSSELAARLAS
jgi:hypothetical protein